VDGDKGIRRCMGNRFEKGNTKFSSAFMNKTDKEQFKNEPMEEVESNKELEFNN
jgi:hypothetical protein